MMRNILITAGTLAIVSLSLGCSVHDSSPIPEPALPLRYSKAVAGVDNESPIERWWSAFDDATLSSLVEEAMKSNLDLAMAFSRLTQAEATARSAGARLYPALDVGVKSGRESQLGQTGRTTRTSHGLSFTASYEIDLWEKNANQAAAANWNLQASAETLRIVYISLTAQVAEFYFQALEMRSQLNLLDKIIQSLEETEKRVTLRYEAGLAPALDIHQARQLVAAARARRPLLEKSHDVAANAIMTILARPAGGLGLSLPGSLPPAPPPPSIGAPASLLMKRPDIEAALFSVRAADARVASALAERYPAVTLLGTAGYASFDTVPGISGTLWSVAASLLQPLFDGYRREAEAERQQAVLDEAVLRYRQTVLNALRDVEDGLAEYATARERLTLLDEQLESVEANLRLARDGYFQGVNSFLEVLLAERQYYEVESQKISALRQLLSSHVGLVKALGGDWPREEMRKHMERADEEIEIDG